MSAINDSATRGFGGFIGCLAWERNVVAAPATGIAMVVAILVDPCKSWTCPTFRLQSLARPPMSRRFLTRLDHRDRLYLEQKIGIGESAQDA